MRYYPYKTNLFNIYLQETVRPGPNIIPVSLIKPEIDSNLPSLLLNTNDLIRWEGERDLRLKMYDTQRHKPDPIPPTATTNVSINQASSSKLSGSNKTANYKVRGRKEKKMSHGKGEENSQDGGSVGKKRTISPEGGKQKRRSSKRIKIKR